MMTGRDVVAMVASEFKVSLAEVLGPSRLPLYVTVRHAAAWVLHHRSRAATSQAIAQMLGRADHSTALHSIKQADIRREREPGFAARLDKLLAAAESDTPPPLPFGPARAIADKPAPQPRRRIYDSKGRSFTIDGDGFDLSENAFHQMMKRGSRDLALAIARERAAV